MLTWKKLYANYVSIVSLYLEYIELYMYLLQIKRQINLLWVHILSNAISIGSKYMDKSMQAADLCLLVPSWLRCSLGAILGFQLAGQSILSN